MTSSRSQISVADNPFRHLFRFRNLNFNYEKHGSGSHAVVLIHGFGSSIESWRDIEPVLEKSFTVYLFDLKGSGLSDMPNDGKYSPNDQAEVVASFIEGLAQGQVTLVGNSYGGAIVLMVYRLLPIRAKQRIRSLVLINSAAYPQVFPWHVRLLRIPILNRLILRLTTPTFRARLVLRNMFFNKKRLTQERIRRHAQFFGREGSGTALISMAKEILPKDMESFIRDLRLITLPTLIVWGEADSVIPVGNARRLNQDICGSKLIVFKDSGHLPQEELPERTSAAMIEFLASLEAES
jgi:pimeloyl-ACP methyl ester carboxylesterase